jgi:sterol desaturase/sphingolipid hydroxylase (fatty acid hydroxylase superfamily)
MLHRFGHHQQGREKLNSSQQLHQHHHTHPTEIKVTLMQRILFFSISSASLWMSFRLNVYFSLASGFVIGITMFFFMHYILHQKWSIKIFPRLHRFHIYHHCKLPDSCHGITVPWWDILFKTIPKKNLTINEKILAFYYKKSKSPK